MWLAMGIFGPFQASLAPPVNFGKFRAVMCIITLYEFRGMLGGMLRGVLGGVLRGVPGPPEHTPELVEEGPSRPASDL